MKKFDGTVYKSTGLWYLVKDKKGKSYRCRVKGKFRIAGLKLTNPVAVNDKVTVELENEEEGSITAIFPRENYLVRQSPRKKHSLHLIGANLDLALLVTTYKNPKLKKGFIDRFLLMAEIHDVPAIIIFNKIDLLTQEDLEAMRAFYAYYNNIGYQVLEVSAVMGTGVDQIRELLSDKSSIIVGHSGVGKSTLLNEIQPGSGLKTAELSDYTGKGQHTTTFAEMFDIGQEGRLIDTPGIKSLSFNHMEKMDIAHNFREYFELSPNCKFDDCLHVDEPKCAVLNGLVNGTILETRYEQYLSLLDEVDNQNYWEIHKDF